MLLWAWRRTYIIILKCVCNQQLSVVDQQEAAKKGCSSQLVPLIECSKHLRSRRLHTDTSNSQLQYINLTIQQMWDPFKFCTRKMWRPVRYGLSKFHLGVSGFWTPEWLSKSSKWTVKYGDCKSRVKNFTFTWVESWCTQRQFRKTGAIQGAKNCDIHLHKTLRTRTSVDLRFRPRALKSAKAVKFRQVSAIDVDTLNSFSLNGSSVSR